MLFCPKKLKWPSLSRKVLGWMNRSPTWITKTLGSCPSINFQTWASLQNKNLSNLGGGGVLWGRTLLNDKIYIIFLKEIYDHSSKRFIAFAEEKATPVPSQFLILLNSLTLPQRDLWPFTLGKRKESVFWGVLGTGSGLTLISRDLKHHCISLVRVEV